MHFIKPTWVGLVMLTSDFEMCFS